MRYFVQCPVCKAVLISDWDGNINSRYRCQKCGSEPYFNNTILPAISVKQPWAFLICAWIKDIENRTWKLPEKYKGKRVLIHAGMDYSLLKSHPANIFTKEQWLKINENESSGMEFTAAYWMWHSWKQKNPIFSLSAIIGSVEIVDCVINHPSIWAEKTEGVTDVNTGKFIPKRDPGPVYNWVLKNPALFDQPILNVKGQLSFFKPKID